MCGLAGIISQNKGLVSKQVLQDAVHCLRHRGPDAEAVWTNEEGTVALGHRRLGVIDPGFQSAQPMHYGNRFTIIHNGEIYNYLELKKQLYHSGYRFNNESDTEVILAAYSAWGPACLQKFDGMFAFAIWDEREQTLFVARDRFGEKPLFFFHDEGKLVFASELKALWQLGVRKQVNQSMLYNFLTIGYTTNPGDPKECFYEWVNKLPAASWMQYNLVTNELQINKYWEVDTVVDQNIKEAEAIERFHSLFTSSIRHRLRSDVAIGTSLSGGLDSSSVVAFCDKEQAAHYSHQCFTASFPGFEKDETSKAIEVAKAFGLNHHLVEIKEDRIVPLMEEVMEHQEEPFSSASVLAQYEVYRAARQNGVTVLLDGQGADEVLAGYHRYYQWYWRELYRTKKLGASGEMEAARKLGVQEGFGLGNKIAALMPEFAAAMLQGRRSKKAFRHPDLEKDFAFSNKRNLYYSLPSSFDLNGALYFNSFVNGLEELLRLADRNSMAHGTELRLPFLNHELVQFLFSLPPSFKIHGGWTKWILRKAVDKKLPDEITWRKDKLGFEPPQKKWMENAQVQQAIREAKNKLFKEGILSREGATKKIQPHTAYAAEQQDWKYWTASFLFA